MIHHVVLIKLSDTTTDDDRRALVDGLNSLPSTIPEIRSFTAGPASDPVNADWDLGLSATFVSRDDHQAYLTHPDHQRVVAEHLRPALASITSLQFEAP